MARILEEILIKGSKEYVFQIAQDYDSRLNWDPFLQDIKFVTSPPELKRGLQVWVKAHNGMEMTVEYVNYKFPDHVSIKMIEGPRIFTKFSSSWKFINDVDRENVTRVIFDYLLNLKWYLKPVSIIVKMRIARDMRKRLFALKTFCETIQDNEKV